jgi:hypothetical protein
MALKLEPLYICQMASLRVGLAIVVGVLGFFDSSTPQVFELAVLWLLNDSRSFLLLVSDLLRRRFRERDSDSTFRTLQLQGFVDPTLVLVLASSLLVLSRGKVFDLISHEAAVTQEKSFSNPVNPQIPLVVRRRYCEGRAPVELMGGGIMGRTTMLR